MTELWKCEGCGGEDEAHAEGWVQILGRLNNDRVNYKHTDTHLCSAACLCEYGFAAALTAGSYYVPAVGFQARLEIEEMARLFAAPCAPEPVIRKKPAAKRTSKDASKGSTA